MTVGRLHTFRLIARHMGYRWIGYRVYHALLHKAGVLQHRLPAMAWDDLKPIELFNEPALADAESLATCRADNSVRFLFDPADRDRYRDLLRGIDYDAGWASAKIDQYERGEISYFSNKPIEVGFPPKWNDNLFEDKPGPELGHFSRLNEFGYGDVKCIWEPSRFSFAYDLVRAYWRSNDERAPELFWHAAEDWIKHNPPNTGINWKCGQESAFRAMAWCFALWGFADSPATTNERVAMTIRLMAVTARRIEAHLQYALSQKNNHGISEAMGLFTIGLLFPELRGAERWVKKGVQHLESQARDLIYDDGAFSQHSINYHRVMLHDYLYAIRIGELNGQPLSQTLVDRVAQAGRFLLELQDTYTGQVPRYGQDDGALVLPLSTCSYEDYRPVVQAAVAVVTDESLPWAHGPWDEEALWMTGPERLQHLAAEVRGAELGQELRCAQRGPEFSAIQGGVYILRSREGKAVVRAQTFRHRPAQLDQLHVDMWWRGVNVVLDPGTYSYNHHDAVWASLPLACAAAHNTVMIQGKDLEKRIGKFLFLPWPQAEACFGREEITADSKACVTAILTRECCTFKRKVLRLGHDHWCVLDTLSGRQQDVFCQHWNLVDAPYHWDSQARRLDLELEAGMYRVQVGVLDGSGQSSLVRASETSSRGWYAPRYQKIAPCLSLKTTVSAQRNKSLQIFSVFGPGAWEATLQPEGLVVDLGHQTVLVHLDDECRVRQIGDSVEGVTSH